MASSISYQEISRTHKLNPQCSPNSISKGCFRKYKHIKEQPETQSAQQSQISQLCVEDIATQITLEMTLFVSSYILFQAVFLDNFILVVQELVPDKDLTWVYVNI